MSTRRRSRRGQALVEFALVLPLFLALLIGAVDLGRAVWANDSLAAAAREAARFAIVHGGSATTKCPVGPPGPDAIIPPASASCQHPSPSKDGIRAVALGAAQAAGSDVTVTVCYGAGCSGDTDAVDASGRSATNVRGTPITVVVQGRVDMVLPSIVGFRSFTLTGSSTMLVNH